MLLGNCEVTHKSKNVRKPRDNADKSNATVNLEVLMHKDNVSRLRELPAEAIPAAGAPMNGSNMAGAPGWEHPAVEAPGWELPGLWWEHPDGNMTGASAPTSGAPSEDSREHPCQWVGASIPQSGSSRTCIGSMGGSFRHPLPELLWELPYLSVLLMAGAPVTGGE
ncbi:hypothetical protein FB451DRAFT_1168733 [Mycena latifolia]|nr:hypothetical protein FB451DRAFT_1168733 [Mycena latifolia]